MKKQNKSLKEIWEQVPPNYYESGIKANLFQWIWHNWEWYSMTKILKDLNPKPSKVLDIGCSAGPLTARIAEFYPKTEVFGLDSYNLLFKLVWAIWTKTHRKVWQDSHLHPFNPKSLERLINKQS